MARTEAGLEAGARRDPELREEFWDERERARRRRRAESVAREGRPRGRLPRVRRAAVPRRAGSRGIVRRPLPRGVPDPDGEAKRDDEHFCHVAAWEYAGDGSTARIAQGAAACSRNVKLDDAELQVTTMHRISPPRLAPEEPRTRTGGMVDATRPTDVIARHVVPRDARRRQRAADREGRGADRVRSRLPRRHLRHVLADDQRRAARARSQRHDDLPAPHAVTSTTATRSGSSRGAPTRSRSSRIWCVDRSAFDRIIQAGGFITRQHRRRPDANAIPIAEEPPGIARWTRPRASAAARAWRRARTPRRMLFVAAKVSHLAHLPQGQPERLARVRAHGRPARRGGLRQLHEHYECEAACPKEISVRNIALLNRHYGQALLSGKDGGPLADSGRGDATSPPAHPEQSDSSLRRGSCVSCIQFL